MADAIALVTLTLLVVIAGVHLYWAAGGRWPGRDAASLEALVVGGRPGAAMPGVAACVAVAVLIGCLVVGLAAVRGWIAVPLPGVVRGLTWVAAAALLVRGLEGFVDHRLRAHVLATPFARWNRVLYSPLCLGLAGGVAVALLTS